MSQKRTLIVGLLVSFIFIVSIAFNACSKAKFSKVAEPDPNNVATGIFPGCSGPDCPEFCEGSRCQPCYGDSCTTPKFPVSYTSNFTVPSSIQKVDILMVLDNSQSMAPEHQKLSLRLNKFLEVLNNNQVDWQICYTLTHVEGGDGELKTDAGAIREWYNNTHLLNFSPIGSKILRSNEPNAEKYFANTMTTLALWNFGSGSGHEQPVRAGLLAVDRPGNQECFRPDAALAMVTLTDEDERSCGARCQTKTDVGDPHPNHALSLYTDQYRPLTNENNPETLAKRVMEKWPGKTFTSHSISILREDRTCYDTQDSIHPAFYGHVVQTLSDITDGEKGTICADDYASQLTAIGQRTIRSLSSVTLRCAPESVTAITITPNDTGSVGTVAGNKVHFTPPLPEGTSVRVDYVCLE